VALFAALSHLLRALAIIGLFPLAAYARRYTLIHSRKEPRA
jgi:hypothetical protein